MTATSPDTQHPARLKHLPPMMPGGLPYVGHIMGFRQNPVALLKRGYEQLGDCYSVRLLGNRATILTGPQANRAFFMSSEDQFSPREAYQFTVPVFGKGIAYDAEPDVMDEQLGFVMPALRTHSMHKYVGQIQDEAEQYFATWSDEGEVDILKTTQALTTFIASRCLLGWEFRTQVTDEFIHLFHDLEQALTPIAFFLPYLPIPAFRRRDRARSRMGELFSQIIADRRTQGRRADDFLQIFMEARYANGTSLTDDEITGLLLTLVFAGHHTSAVMAAWTGILLLQHPQYLSPILQEQKEVCGGKEALTYDAICRLVNLEHAIKEAERMYPPLIILMRKILKDFEYGDYILPTGDLVMVSPAVSHRIPEVFSDPDRYNPDRFGPGREEDQKQPHSLIGFGGGKHRCLGFHFAYLQIKVIWSVLFRDFDFELIDASYQPDYTTLVVGPRQPCLLRYRRKH